MAEARLRRSKRLRSNGRPSSAWSANSPGWQARDFFLPYLQAYRSVQAEMSFAKRSRGLLFLDDVNRELHRYLDKGIVPDVYFRLGRPHLSLSDRRVPGHVAHPMAESSSR